MLEPVVHGLGTLLNTGTVLVGGAVGLTLSQRISGSLQQTMRAAIGLFTAVIGIQMALRSHNALILLLSLLGGVVIGEILRLDDRVAALGRWVEHRLARGAEPGRVSLGFVTASLLFCVGPLAILGSFEDGTRGNITLLLIKSTLDGFSAIVLAAALGWGVLLSALSVLVIQGSLTLVAAFANAGLDDAQVAEVTAVGGIAVLAIALGLLELKTIKVVNLLPALVLAPILVPVLTPLLASLR